MTQSRYIKPEDRSVPRWPETKENMLLLDRIRSYSQSDIYPLHMPGHKRNVIRFGDMLRYSLDMTESVGMADLHDPSGLLEERQNLVAQDFGAAASFYLVNGSSAGNLAAIRSLTHRGDKILFGRNAHKSAFNALELCDLTPIYLIPEADDTFGMFASYKPANIARYLDADPDIRTVFLTSPTFEGVISDIRGIAEVCHAHGARLIVDEAHGAHFHYTDRLKGDAISLGADAVIESLHKTLPSMTATSLLHISKRVDPLIVARNLSIFETSSPSHLLLASIDECEEFMRREGVEACSVLYETLDRISEKFRALRHLRVLGMGEDRLEDHPACFALDPSKITITTKYTPIYGMDLVALLRDRGFEVEMCYGDYVMAITTVADDPVKLLAFADAVLAIDATLEEDPNPVDSLLPGAPEQVLRTIDAVEAAGELIPVEASVGHISHEYVWCYPPGIPLLVPGERITQELVDRFTQLQEQKIKIKTTSHAMPEKIDVVK